MTRKSGRLAQRAAAATAGHRCGCHSSGAAGGGERGAAVGVGAPAPRCFTPPAAATAEEEEEEVVAAPSPAGQDEEDAGSPVEEEVTFLRRLTFTTLDKTSTIETNDVVTSGCTAARPAPDLRKYQSGRTCWVLSQLLYLT